jgi:hypothetical protein
MITACVSKHTNVDGNPKRRRDSAGFLFQFSALPRDLILFFELLDESAFQPFPVIEKILSLPPSPLVAARRHRITAFLKVVDSRRIVLPFIHKLGTSPGNLFHHGGSKWGS